ncbi:MAG: DUF1844 domain-containing protein [Burkholderiales bacterium]|nr:DUF1844 domain-containing protein [Phycisphaerae bacterium]
MSDTPSIQIDSDWKRQAQEEKRKLAEEQAKSKAPPAAAPAQQSAAPAARRLPEPSFATLVQSSMTQALYYLGELAEEGEQPPLSLDMAKHHIDTLAILDQKTKGNLTPDEQRLLDQTIYDLRARFVGIARQMIQ